MTDMTDSLYSIKMISFNIDYILVIVNLFKEYLPHLYYDLRLVLRCLPALVSLPLPPLPLPYLFLVGCGEGLIVGLLVGFLVGLNVGICEED